MDDDPISLFEGLLTCPDCGTLQNSSATRCPECGLFNTPTTLRPEATVEEARAEAKSRSSMPIDPTHYSLNPSGPIVESEETEDSTSVSKPWQGGVTDFTFEEE
jgi:predicted ATP-dependent serine protease